MKVVIVGMIYKSTKWLKSMVDSIHQYTPSNEQYEVDYVVVANDASEHVLDYIKSNNIKHMIYNDPKPNDYYLNRVYRAWNFGGINADGDVIVFVNSDMIFSDNWLENLIEYLNPNTIPCSKLVESGKMPSHHSAVSINCGQTVDTYNDKMFRDVISNISSPTIKSDGLYMPVAFYKDDFIKSGGYPEGNIYVGGEGRTDTAFVRSGDDHFFHYNEYMKTKCHLTVQNSIVYHFQEGELDE